MNRFMQGRIEDIQLPIPSVDIIISEWMVHLFTKILGLINIGIFPSF